jgi:large subunit ribosomal protein L30
MAEKSRKLRVTLVKSAIGYEKSQSAAARALGLRRLNSTVIVDDNPTNRGQINKIIHLVKVEEIEA